jgi:sirohydrochlorin cobaltochelatase
MSADDQQILQELRRRFRTLLPEEYQDSYENLQPAPMGSAGVRYGADGKIAWDQMWGSFCELAMAGGPPHKGALLEPAPPHEIEADRAGYAAAVAEISRGIEMVTDLSPSPSPSPGWLRMECVTSGMSAWLLRAITIENVAVRADGAILELPAGPAYRLLKEVRNVITVIAKTAHYWVGHMSVSHRQTIANLMAAMNHESPLIRPCYALDADRARQALAERVAAAIQRDTALPRSPHRHPDWLGLECGTPHAAVWMMRMLVAANVLARRERAVLFVPIDMEADPDGAIVSSSVALVHRLSRREPA